MQDIIAFDSYSKKLYHRIDNSALVLFRILFGFLLAWQSFYYIASGWVYRNFILPKFTFTFIGFEWLQPLPGNGMYWYFALMGVSALMVMVGLRYRLSLIVFIILWAGVYFMQKTVYNNHHYLLLLVCIIMVFLPANAYASLDSKKLKIKSTTMPAWCSYVIVLQIGIVYFYAAVAKLYPEWLDGTFTGNLLTKVGVKHGISFFTQKWFHIFIAYAGIAFDLFIVPLLLFRKTRTIALIAAVIFHVFNSITLSIGIFPYFSLAILVFFFPPENIRKIFFKNKPVNVVDAQYIEKNKKNRNILLWFFLPYFIIQILMPVRHHFIKGDVLWTEEGHRLSWRMMLRSRKGYAEFKIKDTKTGKTWLYNLQTELTDKQIRQMQTKPDMLWQMAQHIKQAYAENGQNVAIYITAKASLNNNPARLLIDPKIDMAQVAWKHFIHNEWILIY
jgi:hypothetical protein